MSPEAISARLAEVGRLTDLRDRLRYKIDYTPVGIDRRLRQVDQLNALCRSLASPGQTA